MLVLKTDHGNFGSFKDLYLYMKFEKVEKVKCTTNYILDDINTQWLTIEEVKKIIEG